MGKVLEVDFHAKRINSLYHDAIALQSLGRFHDAFMKINFLAEKGYVPAQFDLGWFYYNGRGVSKNLEKAVFWWKKAKKNGYKDAELTLKTIKNHNMIDSVK